MSMTLPQTAAFGALIITAAVFGAAAAVLNIVCTGFEERLEEIDVGGRPSKGTKADRRLKGNKPRPKPMKKG